MNATTFFGYGSLVNLATHGYDAPRPARLSGWRRAWRHTHHRQVSFLTAVRAEGSDLWGMVADVPGGDWAALDDREYAYERVMVCADVEADLPATARVAVYAIKPGQHFEPTRAHPILQSYLDTVMQGYLSRFGEEGLMHFLDTTDGWNAPVLQDRAAPQYSRAQPLSARERRLFDALLDTREITRIKA